MSRLIAVRSPIPRHPYPHLRKTVAAADLGSEVVIPDFAYATELILQT
jgi:hypothetical protein